MRRRVDPLGTLLVGAGALDEEALQDVLARQRHTLPLASLAYVLGHADEESLVRELAWQAGVPGVVLDRCAIQLSVLDGFERELALAHDVLPVFEGPRRLFVAVADPQRVAGVLRELGFVRGKTVVPHIALSIVLARTLRACYAARARGDGFWSGPLLPAPAVEAHMAVVAGEDAPRDPAAAQAREAVLEDVTKEVVVEELLSIEELPAETDTTQMTAGPITAAEVTARRDALGEDTLELDDFTTRDEVSARHEAGGPPRVLVVDDDFAARQLLVKELAPDGYDLLAASGGAEAVRCLRDRMPDAVILDVMLPEIDGFQICRAVKQSQRYRHIPVILMSAVIDSGRVTDEVLEQYGADAYFEKPLSTERIRARLRDLLAHRSEQGGPRRRDLSFQRALELYRGGDVDGAIEELRRGLEDDPLSAKHRYVLANLLQKKRLLYEAIDEYEATVDLRPDYFPALTRLAYLYYEKGFSAKAIETWRRSLPLCRDAALRANIEVFMRRLIADMAAEG